MLDLFTNFKKIGMFSVIVHNIHCPCILFLNNSIIIPTVAKVFSYISHAFTFSNIDSILT
jgi:hypothetical protein